jgi:hypothetical protein
MHFQTAIVYVCPCDSYVIAPKKKEINAKHLFQKRGVILLATANAELERDEQWEGR